MATCTMMKPKTGTWAETFPNQQMTEQESLQFVKKLLAIAVSNITYLRVILPEKAFVNRSVEGVDLKILKCDKSCPGVPLLVDWLNGAFDAVEKKYLHILVLGVYRNKEDPDTLIEAYTFKFSYTDSPTMDIYKNDKKISSTRVSDRTKQATVALLRTLIVLIGTLKPLPDSYMVNMKLFYYEEVTPADYEPPSFKAADASSMTYEDKPLKYSTGEVSTLFHTLKMRVTTTSANFKDDLADNAIQNGQGEQQMALEGLDVDEEDEEHQLLLQQQTQKSFQHHSQHKILQDSEGKHKNAREKIHNKCVRMEPEAEGVTIVHQEEEEEKTHSSISSKASVKKKSTKTDSTAEQRCPEIAANCVTDAEVAPDENHQNFGVRCPCGCDEDDGLMILCSVCGHWQHGFCFLIQKPQDAPEQHICNICSNPDEPSLQPTDPSLTDMSGEELQMTCLWRRALMACTEEKFMTVGGFSNRLGVEKTVAGKIMQRLEKEGYLKPATGKLSKHAKSINIEKITKEGIQKYFQKNLPSRQISQVRASPRLQSQNAQVQMLSKSNKKLEQITEDIQTLTASTSNLALATSKDSSLEKSFSSNKSGQMRQGTSPQTSVNRSQAKKTVEPVGAKQMPLTGNDVYDFEFSNTQEDYELGPEQKKRKKASTSLLDLQYPHQGKRKRSSTSVKDFKR